MAVSLLGQAADALADADRAGDPAARFVAAYLAAHRAAAAILVARGRPHRGRARPESVWTLLEAAAPELREWAAFFSGYSARHAAARAGVSRRITAGGAAGLADRAGEFVVLARRAVEPDERPTVGHTTAANTRAANTRAANNTAADTTAPDNGVRGAWCGARSRPGRGRDS